MRYALSARLLLVVFAVALVAASFAPAPVFAENASGSGLPIPEDSVPTAESQDPPEQDGDPTLATWLVILSLIL
jgi:hypothetical protein